MWIPAKKTCCCDQLRTQLVSFLLGLTRHKFIFNLFRKMCLQCRYDKERKKRKEKHGNKKTCLKLWCLKCRDYKNSFLHKQPNLIFSSSKTLRLCKAQIILKNWSNISKKKKKVTRCISILDTNFTWFILSCIFNYLATLPWFKLRYLWLSEFMCWQRTKVSLLPVKKYN